MIKGLTHLLGGGPSAASVLVLSAASLALFMLRVAEGGSD